MIRRSLLLLALAGTLAACDSPAGPAEPPNSPAAQVRSASTSAVSSRTATQAGSASMGAASRPTATQAMVCGEEIKREVTQALQLPVEPKTRSSLIDSVFGCVYDLPMGTLRFSVKHSATDSAALAYLTSRRGAVGANESLLGLSAHSYATGTGIVLVAKDNEILEVDTTSLPTVFGDLHQKRVDLAYELASAVLGCWTGHD